MALIDANGNFFQSLSIGRVRYTAESTQSVVQDDSIQLPKAPDLIKSQLTAAATDVFFDSGTDYTPNDVLKDSIDYNYGDTIFYNQESEINLVFLSQAISGDCLDDMNDFVKNDLMIKTVTGVTLLANSPNEIDTSQTKPIKGLLSIQDSSGNEYLSTELDVGSYSLNTTYRINIYNAGSELTNLTIYYVV